LRTAFRNFVRRLSETDEERLADEIREWADSIPGTIRVNECPQRSRVKVAGVVRRITIRPVEGLEALEAVLWDGTGDVTAVWLGRRSIPGLALGSRILIDGVLGKERERPRIVNPTFEFA
jgi:hypothetical protein